MTEVETKPTLPADAPKVEANPEKKEPETTVEPKVVPPAEPDYKEKFGQSSKEALRLLEETKVKDAEIARLKQQIETGAINGNDLELYPGFENLGEEEQKNLKAFTETIEKRALDRVYKDPAIVFAKQSFNERQWDSAFETVANEFPDLRTTKDDFKTKYFRADNVPSNIVDILRDVAKIHLFDKAKDLGAQEAAKREADRIEVERSQGGEPPTTSSRTLEDWDRMAKSNPAEFAKHHKEFNEDLKSGKLK